MHVPLLTYPRIDSVFRRMDPRWKLAGIGLAVITAAGLQSVAAVAAVLGLALACLFAARLPASWFLRRLGGMAAFLSIFLIVMPLTMPDRNLDWGLVRVSERGLTLAALVWCKALAVVALTLLLLATTPFDVLLKSAHALWIPGLVIQLLTLTHRYVFLLSSELGRLRIALRVRGFRERTSVRGYRTLAQVTGVLLVRSFERAERVGQAMRCRGYDGRYRSLAEFRTRLTDVLNWVGMVILFVALPLVLERCR